MAYVVEVTRRASRDLAALPADARRRVARRIDSLASEARPASARKLSGADDLYRIRVGDYRIIYQVRDTVLLVLVIMVRHRGTVYEDLARLLRGR